MNFGEELRKMRKSKGLTLDELAEASNLSKGYLSRLEGGKRKVPKLETLKKIAVGLDVSVEEVSAIAGYINRDLIMEVMGKIRKQEIEEAPESFDLFNIEQWARNEKTKIHYGEYELTKEEAMHAEVALRFAVLLFEQKLVEPEEVAKHMEELYEEKGGKY